MNKYKDKKVLVVGFGISGVAAARYLCDQGAKVTVTDSQDKTQLTSSVDACAQLPIEYDLGRHQSKTFLQSEYIVVSPGVPLNIKPLEEAKESKIPIISEIELALEDIHAPLIAITGTNGKTTTTALIGEMFKADQKNAFVGGNIGKPLTDFINEKQDAHAIVAELSSFQLELTHALKPKVAVFTNIEPDHLDRYPDMESYVRAKKQLLSACTPETFVVLNLDNLQVAAFDSEKKGKTLWFTKKSPSQASMSQFQGAYFDYRNKRIVFKMNGEADESYDLSLFRLFGEHNRENLLAAICAARAMGVAPASIQKVISSFPGVPHRLEYIRKKDGVFFFNDSKGTNVGSVKRSLESFPSNPIILIAGGKDKNSDFSSLTDIVRNRCKILVLVGEAKEKINRALGDFAETYLVGTFEEAVLLSYQKSRRGDIVLLSPGCASYDMFKNFEERGDYFKKLVAQL